MCNYVERCHKPHWNKSKETQTLDSDNKGVSDEKDTPKYLRVTDYFQQELYPLAISIGMPSDEFWNDDPIYLLSYVKAFERVNEIKSQNIDYNSWLIGVYCETAFASVISNAFSKSNGKNRYPKQPFSFKKTNNVSDEDRLNAQYTQFFALSKNINKKFKK